MSINNTQFNVKNYTDVQGLASIRGQAKKNPELANREVAQQFEALLLQMLLKSMRDANKAFSQGEGSNDQTELYQDLFDKQVSLAMAGQSNGLGKQIEQYLQKVNPGVAHKDVATNPVGLSEMLQTKIMPADPQVEHLIQARIAQLETKVNSTTKTAAEPLVESAPKAASTGLFDNELSFVKNLWQHAKKAAEVLSVDPKLLLAQAALETGWGKRIISQGEAGSSHNLFNIKATPNSSQPSVISNTLEHKDGIVTKEKAAFRVYDSFADSFDDYVQLIKTNPRYQAALRVASNPSGYLQNLQKAHYATDINYTNKVMNIYKSSKFNDCIKKILD